MNTNKITNWTIGECCTKATGVVLSHFRGTATEVQIMLLKMVRRKIKITDFIQTCETNCRLKHLADSFVPSCSLYDVIDGNYVPPQKEKTSLKNNRRILVTSVMS